VAVQAAGWWLRARKEPAAAAARLRVLRFGAIVPTMAVVVGLFAVLAARSGVAWAATGVLAIGGFAAAMQLTSMSVEMRAAAAGILALRASRLAFRRGDLRRIERCAKAAAWRRALPLAMHWVVGPARSGTAVRPQRE